MKVVSSFCKFIHRKKSLNYKMQLITDQHTLIEFLKEYFDHKISNELFLNKLLEILTVIRMDLEIYFESNIFNKSDYGMLLLFLNLCVHYNLNRGKIGQEINKTFFELIYSSIESSSDHDIKKELMTTIFEPLENQLALYLNNIGFKIEPFSNFFTMVLSGILYIIRGRKLEFNYEREVKGKLIKLVESNFSALNIGNKKGYVFQLSFECLTPLTEYEKKNPGWYHMKGLSIEFKGYKNCGFIF